MKLTDEQIDKLNCIELDREDYEVFSVNKQSVQEFARAVESTMRAQYEPVLRELVEVLEEISASYMTLPKKGCMALTRAQQWLENGGQLTKPILFRLHFDHRSTTSGTTA